MRDRGVRGIRPRFRGLSPCGGQVAYVLLTSAPVAARRVATPAMPLDLHVLSLSLAFILSQDQTLRCCILVFSSLSTRNRAPSPACGIFAWDTDRRRVDRSQDHARFTAVSFSPVGNLTWSSDFLSLSLALSIPLLIANISKIVRRFLFGVKKIAHSILHLVRRNRCKITATFPNTQAFRDFFRGPPDFFAGMGALAFADAKVQPFSEPPNFFGTFFSKKSKKITPLPEKAAPHLITYTRASRRGHARAPAPTSPPPGRIKKTFSEFAPERSQWLRFARATQDRWSRSAAWLADSWVGAAA